MRQIASFFSTTNSTIDISQRSMRSLPGVEYRHTLPSKEPKMTSLWMLHILYLPPFWVWTFMWLYMIISSFMFFRFFSRCYPTWDLLASWARLYINILSFFLSFIIGYLRPKGACLDPSWTHWLRPRRSFTRLSSRPLESLLSSPSRPSWLTIGNISLDWHPPRT